MTLRPPLAVSAALLATLAAVAVPFSLTAQTPAQNDSAAAAAAKGDSLPLIPMRTLSFETDEGTWLSLDLSPDGSTIVFDLLGDLYTLPVEGGTATRITSGQGYDMQPRFSPDGERIVFVSDRTGREQLWLANADGSDAEVLTSGSRGTNHMSPIFDETGDYVLAVQGSDIRIYHVDGGAGAEVTGDEDAPAMFGPALGADPNTLWVNLRGGFPSGFALDADPLSKPERLHDHYGAEPEQSSLREVGTFQIAEMDRSTGELFVRTHDMEGAFRPMPSPDGRWLAYVTRWDDRNAIKLMDLESREESWLVMDVARDESQGGGSRDRDLYPGSAWTPDSRALITSWGGKIRRVEVPSGEVSVIPFTATVEQEMGPLVKFDYPIDDASLTVSQIRGARPSPDGSKVVFSALARLWVADLPDPEARAAAEAAAEAAGEEAGVPAHPVITNARRLTDAEVVEHGPVWSPDGEWVAYATWSDDEGGDIWKVRADGRGEPQRLTPESKFYDKLMWSRDGTRIVAVQGSKMHRMRTLEDFGRHGSAAELEYVWLPSNGGEPTRIAWVGSGQTQEGRNVPHIGPDADRVYVWTGEDAGLVSMRWDGTDVRPVVNVAGPRGNGRPDEVVLSPDGKYAVVRSNRNVYMVTVPRVGGEPPTIRVGGSSSVPTWDLTDIGGDFVGWRPDGAIAHFSIGRSYFEWSPAEADSVADLRAEMQRERRAARAAAGNDAAGDDAGDAGDADPESASDAEADDDEEEPLPEYAAARTDVEIVVAKDRPEGVLALTNARLLTMNEDREIIERGDVVIRDNRIAAIGPSGSVEIPADAEVRDMTGMTIYPGLVDIHAHTWVSWGVHRTQVSQFLAQLAYGVTTQRDPQTSSHDVVTFSDRMETGELIGPRIYSTGPGIFSSDGIESLEDARNVLRRYSDHFNTLTIKQYLAGDRDQRQWVIMAANELGLTPTTEGGSNFTMNLSLMQDGYAGIEHNLPISPFFRDVVQLASRTGIALTPTLVVAYGGPSGMNRYITENNLDDFARLRRFTPHDELDKWQDITWYRDDQWVHPLHAAQLTKVVEAGGVVGLGSHGEVQGLGTHWELWMMASGGMDPHDALKAATIDGADAIGLDGDLGSLEVGKLADLQILDANPLDDLRNTTSIVYVMKNGRMYESETLDEVWPRQRPLPEMWWWRVEPPTSMVGGN